MSAARPLMTRIAAGSLAVAATLLASAMPAHADVIYNKLWVATAHASDGIAYGTWHPCAAARQSPHAARLTCGKSTGTTKSFTMSITGSQEVGTSRLSAEVGYTVARTITTSIAYTVSVPKNTSTTIYWRTTSYRTKVLQRWCYEVNQTGQCSSGYQGAAKYAYTHKFRAIQWKNT